MKVAQKDSVVWDQIQMRSPSGNTLLPGSVTRPVHKLMVSLILFISVTYVIYTLKLLTSSSHAVCDDDDSPFSVKSHISLPLIPNTTNPQTPSIQNQTVQILPIPHPDKPEQSPTEIRHVVFGIAASAKLWKKRKEYIKIWYRPRKMRAVVWLDDRVKSTAEDRISLPQVRISKDTSNFPYNNKQGHRSAIRISRIVSETLHLKQGNVRWFVMGDDDTVFITENLVRILNKYDHNQYWYIGSSSESHLQNIYFSYGMAYGGGGFAISYPLAKALAKMQDRCIKRYPGLYGSDDRMQACMAELGVPLTKELGFHQYDVYGNLFGLLASHPVAPLVSLHHLDVVEPIFPNATRVQALQHLMLPAKLDSAGIMQQSICYHPTNRWTISVSWGFAVQVFRGIFSPREMEMPSRTFLNWYRRADYTAYAFNTRPVSRNPCQKPFVFYMSHVKTDTESNQTVSKYARHQDVHPPCKWKMTSPEELDTVVVYKKPDPLLWSRSPRRNCCRVMDSYKKGTMMVEVGMCKDGEVSEV